MKILMLLDNEFASDIRVEKEAMDLIAAGHTVSVMCLIHEELPSEDERNGIRILRRFPDEIKSPFRKTYQNIMAHCIDSILLETYDALHCHDYMMLDLGIRVKQRRTTTVIYDAHEYLAGWPFYKDTPSFSGRIKGKIVWKFRVKEEKKNIPKSDYVVTVSQAISDVLKNKHGLQSAPIIVRNFPRKYPVNKDQESFKKRFGIPSDKKVLLYSGAMYHTDRQIRSLYKIVAGIDNLVLLILGSWTRHAEVREIARTMGYEGGKVFFSDYITDPAQRQDVISGADIALMHLRSNWEGHRITFSNKFVEYTFALLPIVSAYQNDCVAIGKKYGHALFYEEDDDQMLEHNIRKALKETDELSKNLSAAREELSWEKEVQCLLDLYARLENNLNL